MSQNLEQIAILTVQRNEKIARIAEIEPKESYLRKFEKIVCPSGPIANSCISYNSARVSEANILLSEINGLKDQVRSIDEQIQVLASVQTATNTATVTLAQTGQSLEALTIAAEGQSKASIEAATIKATAEAQAIKETSNASAINETFRNRLIYGVIAVVVFGVVFIAIKFYLNKR